MAFAARVEDAVAAAVAHVQAHGLVDDEQPEVAEVIDALLLARALV